MAVYASTCITSLASSLARLMGIEAPRGAGEGNPALERYAHAALGGERVRRALLYHPDGIAHYLFARHTDCFLPVLEAAPLALPMQSVYPPVTPVCFASMYTGLEPEGHGIQSYVKPVVRADTLFDAALRAGLRPVIVSTSGSSLSKIFLDRPMDYAILDSVDEVNARAEQLLREDEHDLIVVYNGNYDAAMHRFSPESAEALAALRTNADTFSPLCSIARRVWSGRESLVAFAPDHGCHAVEGGLGTHGLDAPEDMLIPHFYGVW